MDTAILPSTLLLTLLLSVGLFFFIRASTKDRTTTVRLGSEQDEAVLMPKVQEYFRLRSYQVVAVDRDKNQVVFEGFVQPSLFLAVFLSLLAFVGLVCLCLVLSLLLPQFGTWVFGLVLLSPLTGVFYWRKAGRVEQVLFKIDNPDQKTPKFPSQVTVVAHRDEIIELQKTLELKSAE